MPPSSTICASLAALARQPTMAMKIGISGAATSSTSGRHPEQAGHHRDRMNSGTTVARQRAGW